MVGLGGESEDEGRLREYAARMAALEKIKSDFLNLASHELRGPLGVLRGYISMLEAGELGLLSPELKQVLPVLTSKTTQMATIVNQMLEAARLEDERLQLNNEQLDLRVQARKAVGAIGGLAQAGQAILLRNPPRPVIVMGDPLRIESILINLLENAIKYSPDGGEIQVTVRANRDHARVAVADRGIGIATEDMAVVFSRFGRIVTPANSHISGTGLGLYVSREVARMHGGDITAANRPEGGMIFRLRLPLMLGVDSHGEHES